MSEPIYFAPLRVPFVDIQTGIISHPWQLLLQSMFNRIGGTNGLSIDEVLALLAIAVVDASQDPPLIPTIALDDQTPPTIPGLAPDDQSPPVIAQPTSNDVLAELYQARDNLAELQKRIQDLQQGPVSI